MMLAFSLDMQHYGRPRYILLQISARTSTYGGLLPRNSRTASF
jgi:hypothetical protein